VACLGLTAAVVSRARAAEREVHGDDAVFDLAALRPVGQRPEHRVGAAPAYARVLT
jgi:hypothetical protein